MSLAVSANDSLNLPVIRVNQLDAILNVRH